MKYIYKFIIIIILATASLSANTNQRWLKIENIPSPFNTNYWLDIQFLPSNPSYGWVCGFNGMVIRTTNGGNSGPAGIFKSTDGGATWIDLTILEMGGLWGCYFVDADYGVVLGGGCGGTNQDFWHTTNGGATWTLFQGNEFNSGLSDAIIFERDGFGVASSSGRIWRTLDGGKTWAIHSETGSNVWQEEITYNDGSILVPYAGTTCEGGGNDGGARFTVDNGMNWRQFRTGVPMFGTFLLDKQRGWAVGNNRTAIYTQNGGLNWALKNCGITPGSHLDDVWFITDNNGWVVGDGVYRMAPAEYLVNRDTLKFENTCIYQSKRDTVIISNVSFNTSEVRIRLQNNPTNKFRIVQPNQTLITMEGCQELIIVVEYSPDDFIEHKATLEVTFNVGIHETEVTRNVYLIGKTYMSTAKPENPVATINPAMCGDIYDADVLWEVEDTGERIIGMEALDDTPEVSFMDDLPMNLLRSGSVSHFTVRTIDTGWVEKRFRARLFPCDEDTIITIRAYGVSPIINTEKSLAYEVECYKAIRDTIEITNTGNAVLTIPQITLNPTGGAFRFIGFVGNTTLPASIPIGGTEKIIIEYAPNTIGTTQATLIIENNDKTLTRGFVSPWEIQLTGTSYSPIMELSKISVDLGKICIGTSSSAYFTLSNLGNLDAEIIEILNLHQYFAFPQINRFPYEIKAEENYNVLVTFTPQSVGEFSHKITLKLSPCETELELTLRGEAVDTRLQIEPSQLSVYVQKGTSRDFTINAFAVDSLRITNITYNPVHPEISIDYLPQLHLDMLESQAADFVFTVTGLEVGTYTFTVCFTAIGDCETEECVNITVDVADKIIVANRTELDFGRFICVESEIIENITFTNMGVELDSILTLEISGSPNFYFVEQPNLPIILEPQETIDIAIAYMPTGEGISEAVLSMLTSREDNQIHIPLSGEFYKSDLSFDIVEYDFGILEVCDEVQNLTIILSNSASLDEIVNLIGNNPQGAFSLLTALPIEVKGNESVQFDFSFNPALITTAGIYTSEWIFEPENCSFPNNIIRLSAEIITPRLTYIPLAIDFGDLWVGDVRDEIITVTNNSGRDRTILEINLSENDFELLQTAPILVPNNATIEIPIRFTAFNSGNYSASVEIIEYSVCFDTSYIRLEANVTEENYRIELNIDDYAQKADDIFDLYIELIGQVENFKPETVEIKFAYDYSLMRPLEVYATIDGTKIPIEYNLNIGNFTAIIKGSGLIERLFSESGVLLTLRTKAFASSPNYTDIEFTEFSAFPINTGANIEIALNNGSLTVDGFCEPIYSYGFSFLPQVVAKVINASNSDLIEVKIEAEEEQVITIELTDMLGNRVYLQNHRIAAGENNLIISSDNLASGMYFIKIEQSFLNIFFEKLMLVK